MLLANHLTQVLWTQALGQRGMGRQIDSFHPTCSHIKA
jgi:hypothetical protein